MTHLRAQQQSCTLSKKNGKANCAVIANFGMTAVTTRPLLVSVRSVEVADDSAVIRVRNSRMLGGDTMKKKYRIREGSIIDYLRYGMVGLMFGLVMAYVANTVYPIV